MEESLSQLSELSTDDPQLSGTNPTALLPEDTRQIASRDGNATSAHDTRQVSTQNATGNFSRSQIRNSDGTLDKTGPSLTRSDVTLSQGRDKTGPSELLHADSNTRSDKTGPYQTSTQSTDGRTGPTNAPTRSPVKNSTENKLVPTTEESLPSCDREINPVMHSQTKVSEERSLSYGEESNPLSQSHARQAERSPPSRSSASDPFNEDLHAQRERSAIPRSSVSDPLPQDLHQHRLLPGHDPFDLKYRLYGIVCHSGMLGGGHYVSYAINPNGSWYAYNDSSCRPVAVTEEMDTSCAYMLFYEREKLDVNAYLPDVSESEMKDTKEIDEDYDENEMKKMCSVM